MTPLDLRQSCDLSDSDLAALLNPGSATPAQQLVLRQDGLLDGATLTLTAAGEQLRTRVGCLLHGQEPQPAPLGLPPLPPGSLSAQVACLRYVATHPGVAWRYLTQLFGREVVAQCHSAGWLTGELRRGAPQALTALGIRYVTEEEPR
ncbi:MAG TPA: hypothetical protein PKH77_09750 [Anaerolineae bacterium]|nr:hypothetical protein [Anaerolineae bacterium]